MYKWCSQLGAWPFVGASVVSCQNQIYVYHSGRHRRIRSRQRRNEFDRDPMQGVQGELENDCSIVVARVQTRSMPHLQ